MSEHVALTKTLRDGRTARVTIHQDGSGSGTVWVTSWRGDEGLGSHCGPHHAKPGLPTGYVAAIGKLALTQDEADTVKAAYDEFVAALPRDLHSERRGLVAAVLEAQDRWSDTRTANWDRFDGSGNPFSADNANEQRITAAIEMLAGFDHDHPEVKAAVDARRDVDVRRWAGR